MFSSNFLILHAILWLLVGVILIRMVTHARRAKASQDRLVKSLQGGDQLNWFRIKLATPEFFRKRMKIIAFQSSAVLVNYPDRVRVLAELPNGEKIDRSWPKDALQLEWVGNRGLGSSNMHWVALGGGAEQVMFSGDTGFNAVLSREATADICRMIRPGSELPTAATADFALEKNKASLTAVAIFFALLVFALVDGMVVNVNELVGGKRMIAITPFLAIVGVPAYLLLVRHQVPSRESLTLGILLGIGVSLAGIPAMKRADQILAGGAQPYRYKLIRSDRFEPVEAGPPPLNFRNTREYWAQFAPGSVHEFHLIHGPVGLWQLERAELNAAFRKFYSELDARK